MTLTGIIEITGVILEQRTWRHTDIQTDEYAGIIELTGVILKQRMWRHTDIQTDEYAGIIAK